jgi:hypothetical protein
MPRCRHMAARRLGSGRVRLGYREGFEPSRGRGLATLRKQASAICPSGLLPSKLCRSWSNSAWAWLKAKVCWVELRALLVSAWDRTWKPGPASLVSRAPGLWCSPPARWSQGQWGPSKEAPECMMETSLTQSLLLSTKRVRALRSQAPLQCSVPASVPNTMQPKPPQHH